MEQQQFEFQYHFNELCRFIYKYKDNLSSFTASAFGNFKSSYSVSWNHLKSIKHLKNETFTEFFHLISSKYHDFKISEFYFTKDILFSQFQIIVNLFLSNNEELPQNMMFTPEILEEFKQMIFNFEKKINGNDAILACSNSNINLNSQSIVVNNKLESINPSLFKNYEECREFISSLFNKSLRYKNHVLIANRHLKEGTTPKMLFYRNYPQPFLSDDAEFINSYNNLVKDIQIKTLNLNIEFLQKRINTIDEKLSQIIINLVQSGLSQETANNNFRDLEKFNNDSLREVFERASEKFSKCKSMPFQVKMYRNRSTSKSKVSFSNNNTFNTYESDKPVSSANSSYTNASIQSNQRHLLNDNVLNSQQNNNQSQQYHNQQHHIQQHYNQQNYHKRNFQKRFNPRRQYQQHNNQQNLNQQNHNQHSSDQHSFNQQRHIQSQKNQHRNQVQSNLNFNPYSTNQSVFQNPTSFQGPG